MGKRIVSQRRGRGSMRYRAPSHRYIIAVQHKKYDEKKEQGIIHGRIINIIHCPGHNSPLAEIKYEDGERGYIFAFEQLAVGSIVAVGSQAPIKIGNTLPLSVIPEGTAVYNIEGLPGDGGQFIRASGTFGTVISKTDDKVIVALPSKKKKIFNGTCRATIGVIAGGGRKEKPFAKAGKAWYAARARGRLYPITSKVAMNPVDHPFGSGRGRHMGKPSVPPVHAPPGRKVGQVRAKRTGRKK